MNSNPMVAGESKVRFRNSFRLLMNNFKSTYVVLLFRLIVLLITGTLAAVIITWKPFSTAAVMPNLTRCSALPWILW